MFTQTTPPTAEPLSLTEAKEHLRVSHDDEDGYINGLIRVAREMVEQHTGRKLITQTWKLVRDDFCGRIDLLPGTQAITGVQYQDTDNAQQTLAPSVYELRSVGLVESLGLKYAQSWPSVLCHPGSVVITFTVGYGASGDDVPTPIKQAMLMLLAQLYENREETVIGTIVSPMPIASEFLLNPYRVPVVG